MKLQICKESNMGYNVLVTRPVPEEGINLLKEFCDQVNVNPEDRVWSKDELMQQIEGNQAILCLLTDKFDADVLDKAKECGVKGIANFAVGYDNIDVTYAASLGITVTNTPGVLTETTAELTWALIFAVARRIVEADKYTRAGKFTCWEPLLLLGQDLSSKTLGIIGAGRIGTEVAHMSQGFRMNILYHDTSANTHLEKEMKAKRVSLVELLQNSDVVSIHTPLTDATHHLIGEDELSLMKPTAILVNAARGPVVDEAALARALRDKIIMGAGLDVYEEEPKVNPDLISLDNVVLCPHIGSASVETRNKMSRMAAENLIAILKGEIPPNPVTY
jgi:lactate dehydrogenase-like 2-hydroxyacid dehydrogenase